MVNSAGTLYKLYIKMKKKGRSFYWEEAILCQVEPLLPALDKILQTIYTYPLLRAVIMQSAQNLCRHSLVVIVFFSMSRQIGHISSLCKLLGDTTISSPSVIASCQNIKVFKI